MRPTIVQPPEVTGAALAELKEWLSINRPNEDNLLSNLMLASLATCEEYISQAPLSKTLEERISAKRGWHALASRPVTDLIQVEAIDSAGLRMIFPDQSANFKIDVEGVAWLFVEDPNGVGNLAIQVSVGIADDWTEVPSALRQGIIRLAAFYYRDRDQVGSRPMPPPESVKSLWQAWRDLRLS